MSTCENKEVETLIKNQFILTQEQLEGFPLMNRLMEHELHEIKSFTLFDNENGIGLIYVTKDDEVFGVGANGRYNLLGVSGHFYKCERVERPVRIEGLCGKEIVSISMGCTIGAAIDATGRVYTWGKELFVLDDIRFPSCESSREIQLISCGHAFLALLGKNGNVRLSGDGMIWKEQEPVVHLSCGHYHMAMLGVSGNVYTWGQNRYSQRSCRRYSRYQDERTVTKIVFDHPCSSVSCGLFSTYFLTNSGELWACHLNVKSNQNRVAVPEKVDIKEKVVKLLTASKNSQYCSYMAVTENDNLWIWDGKNQGTPRLSHVENIAGICEASIPQNVMFQVKIVPKNDVFVKPLSKLILEKLEIVKRLCDEVRKDCHDLEAVVEDSLCVYSYQSMGCMSLDESK
ncbi:Hypothetical protein chromosome condensation (RCC1) and BTB (POZ) domain containing protein [Nesidiocoris tenuis]|uniref:Uncharacterized protein n=1 Tax=Nesidiocoris tenuis TaxID=355587 RepID=A0ABN7AXS8_9HEMI|nr:Hypothetical protein chromosome condensation (RCC1) and BTB (POZ) domain containing protein [Nesidiocoris tenuis]